MVQKTLYRDEDPNWLLFSFGGMAQVLVFDMRNTNMILSEASREYEFCGDEINTVSVSKRHARVYIAYPGCWLLLKIGINERNNFLCTADDLGEVKVIDLESHKLYKQFRTKHQNVNPL